MKFVLENPIFKEKSPIHFGSFPIILSQPVVILFGPASASAAEDFLANMKYQNRAIIVGSPSYGSNVQPFRGKLPGGGTFGICTHRCYMHEGTDYHNVVIKPDVFVDNKVEDYRNGYDCVFVKGLETIRKLIKLLQ
jgi:C-terminal processing protease CtpA/Prc